MKLREIALGRDYAILRAGGDVVKGRALRFERPARKMGLTYRCSGETHWAGAQHVLAEWVAWRSQAEAEKNRQGAHWDELLGLYGELDGYLARAGVREANVHIVSGTVTIGLPALGDIRLLLEILEKGMRK